MSVRFSYTGTKLLSLLRKSGPVVYRVDQPHSWIEFCEENHYQNNCTMKSACFGGDKDQVSTDFDLVIKLPIFSVVICATLECCKKYTRPVLNSEKAVNEV